MKSGLDCFCFVYSKHIVEAAGHYRTTFDHRPIRQIPLCARPVNVIIDWLAVSFRGRDAPVSIVIVTLMRTQWIQVLFWQTNSPENKTRIETVIPRSAYRIKWLITNPTVCYRIDLTLRTRISSGAQHCLCGTTCHKLNRPLITRTYHTHTQLVKVRLLIGEIWQH